MIRCINILHLSLPLHSVFISYTCLAMISYWKVTTHHGRKWTNSSPNLFTNASWYIFSHMHIRFLNCSSHDYMNNSVWTHALIQPFLLLLFIDENFANSTFTKFTIRTRYTDNTKRFKIVCETCTWLWRLIEWQPSHVPRTSRDLNLCSIVTRVKQKEKKIKAYAGFELITLEVFVQCYTPTL